MIESRFLDFEASKLHYIKTGSGKESLLFFHGFGQDHSVYLPIVKALSNDFTLYIFDLYFHGQSYWAHGEKPLTTHHWKQTIDLFLLQNEIKTFSVLGYSIGAKFALATVDAFAHKIQTLYLVAPDGIKKSFWYSIATASFLNRKFFKTLINQYDRFLAITTFLTKYNLADHNLIRFADYQMGTEAKRKRVYYSWTVFRKLSVSNKKLVSLINSHKIRTVVLVGRHDPVIVPGSIEPFIRKINDHVFKVLDAGHSGLLTTSALREIIKIQNLK